MGNGKFHYMSAITLEGELRILSKFHVTANLLGRSLTQMTLVGHSLISTHK